MVPHWLMDSIVEWLAKRVQGMLSGILSLLKSAIFTSPDVTVFPQVQYLAGRSLVIVNAAFILAIIAAGCIVMCNGTFQIQYGAKDLLPRLVVGFVAANFGMQICKLAIVTGNALVEAMVGTAASGPEVIEFVKRRMASTMGDEASGLLAVIIALLIVVLLYTLLVQWFSRVAALIVLAGVAPVALACYCLPQLQPVAQLWWRALLGCLAIPLLQAICFSASVDLLLDPRYNAPILLGLGPAPSTDVLSLAIVVCLLVVTARIPKLVGRYVSQHGRSVSTAGVLLRAVVIQSVTRRLRMPLARVAGR